MKKLFRRIDMMKKLLKKVFFFPIYLLNLFTIGFNFWCLILSKGFYFYGVLFFSSLQKIFGENKFFKKMIQHFRKRQNQPECFLLLGLYIASFCALFNILYVEDRPVVSHDDSVSIEKTEIEKIDGEKTLDSSQSTTVEVKPNISNIDTNLFRKYGKMKLSEVSLPSLKKENSDTVAWLSVDGTNINYPIVQTQDNEFYLNHGFDKKYRNSGWTFMDFRNHISMDDQNTIFYGHNLLNKTSFGSVSNIFTDSWFQNSNHTIWLLTETRKYLYRIFSAYYIEPEVYYLQTNLSGDSYLRFLNILKERSLYSFNDSFSVDDKIITLSTCTEDNQGRKVVHAKLVRVVDY